MAATRGQILDFVHDYVKQLAAMAIQADAPALAGLLGIAALEAQQLAAGRQAAECNDTRQCRNGDACSARPS